MNDCAFSAHIPETGYSRIREMFKSPAEAWAKDFVHADSCTVTAGETVRQPRHDLLDFQSLENQLDAHVNFMSVDSLLLYSVGVGKSIPAGAFFDPPHLVLTGLKIPASEELLRVRVKTHGNYDILVVPEPAGPVSGRFEPSGRLTDYVAEYLRSRSDAQEVEMDLQKCARDKIIDGTFGLFRSMSESLGRSNVERFPLGVGRFEPSIAKALLYRIPVDFYKGPEFVSHLYDEVRDAARHGLIKGRAWRAIADPRQGDLVLLACVSSGEGAPAPVLTERAQVKKYGAR